MPNLPPTAVSDTFLGQMSNAAGDSLSVVVGMEVDGPSGQVTLSAVGAADVTVPFAQFDRGYSSAPGTAATPAQPVTVLPPRAAAAGPELAVFFGDTKGRPTCLTVDHQQLAAFVTRARGVVRSGAPAPERGGASL